jgi:hypothetical protein
MLQPILTNIHAHHSQMYQSDAADYPGSPLLQDITPVPASLLLPSQKQ